MESARARGVDAFSLLLQRNAFIVDLARAMTMSGRAEEAAKLEQALQEVRVCEGEGVCVRESE